MFQHLLLCCELLHLGLSTYTRHLLISTWNMFLRPLRCMVNWLPHTLYLFDSLRNMWFNFLWAQLLLLSYRLTRVGQYIQVFKVAVVDDSISSALGFVLLPLENEPGTYWHSTSFLCCLLLMLLQELHFWKVSSCCDDELVVLRWNWISWSCHWTWVCAVPVIDSLYASLLIDDD